MILDKKRTLITSILVFFLINSFFILRHLITYPILHVEYNGSITKYRFDIKGYSYFQISNNKTEFQMHYLNCDLQIGDSMVKKLDDDYIYHFRSKKLIGIYGAGFGRRYFYPNSK